MTPLDIAYEIMAQDDSRRLGFYEALADGEMFLLLAEEAEGPDLKPQLFPLQDGPVVLIFDLEERLAQFTGGVSPYAALPGRVIARMLAGQGIGLGINLGVAPSEMILPHDAVDWLADFLNDTEPQEAEARPESFHPPQGLPDALLAALEQRLARCGGLARSALISGVRYQGGGRGHMLAFLDADPAAEVALARTVAEALAFCGLEAASLDVAFLPGDAPAARAMAQAALRLDLPEPPAAPSEPAARPGPGTDPDRPPKLR